MVRGLSGAQFGACVHRRVCTWSPCFYLGLLHVHHRRFKISQLLRTVYIYSPVKFTVPTVQLRNGKHTYEHMGAPDWLTLHDVLAVHPFFSLCLPMSRIRYAKCTMQRSICDVISSTMRRAICDKQRHGMRRAICGVLTSAM